MKYCKKCKESKEDAAFYSKSHWKYTCKKCVQAYNRLHQGKWQDRTFLRDKQRFGGQREMVLKRDNYQCVLCGMTNKEHVDKWKRSITIDHIDNYGRYSKVQNNELNNLVTLCLSCHGRKDVYKRLNANKYIHYVTILKGLVWTNGR